MYTYREIKSAHIELTDRCNASCPMCPRNIDGGPTNKYLPDADLSVDEIKRIYSVQFIRQLEFVAFCGTYGDPMMSRDVFPIIEYFREASESIEINLDTNGSIRDEKWWRRLGEFLSGTPHRIVFGIDGSDETHALHRRGTKLEKILRNAQAYIDGGGWAEWSFICFQHNEHQVEACEKLAKEMGFALFKLRKTARFKHFNDFKVMDAVDVINKDGEFEYSIQPAKNPDYVNPVYDDIESLADQFDSHDEYLDKVEIECDAMRKKQIYMSSDGIVAPCSWLAAAFSNAPTSPRSQFTSLVGDCGGVKAISAHHTDIEEIVGSDLIQRIIPESWQKGAISEGKLSICARACGNLCNARTLQTN